MPFVERKPSDVMGAMGLLPEDQIFEPENPSFWRETIPAAFRLQNTIASLLSSPKGPERGVQDEDFDPWGEIQGTVYEQFSESFIDSDTPEDVALVKSNIDRELRDIETLAASGASGWAATFAAGILDPLVLLPFGHAARAAKIGETIPVLAKLPSVLRGGLTTARAGVLGIGTAESLLHMTQETRTLGESAINLAAGTFLAGVLGGAISQLDSALTRAAIKDIQREFGEVRGGSGADPNVPTISAAEAMSDSAGASSNAEIKLKGTFGAARVMAAMRLSPFIRLMVKSRSNALKQTLLDMVEQPVYVEGWTPAIPVESRIQAWDAVRAQLMTARDQSFTRYRFRVTGEKPGGRFRRFQIETRDRLTGREYGVLSNREFSREISRALWSGDIHPIPEVQQMAEFYRTKVFDPLLEQMIQKGILPEEVATKGVAGARSYLSRIYLKDIVIAYDREFRIRIKSWLTNEIGDDEKAAIGKKYAERITAGEMTIESAIDSELDLAVQDIFDNIVGYSDARLPYERMQMGSQRALKQRALTIDDETLRAPVSDGQGGFVYFLETDVERIVDRYLRTVVPDVELHSRFGSVEMTKQLAAIEDEYRALRERTPDRKKKLKLARQMEKELTVMRALRDRLRGTYAVPTEGALAPFTTVFRVGRVANMMAQGGGFMLSSIPDVGMVVLRNGLWRTFRTGILPLVTHFKAVKLSAKEAKLGGVGLEMTLDTRAAAKADFGDEFARNRVERVVQGAARNFMLWNLLAPWNVMMKRWAGVVTQTRMIEAIEDFALGRISKLDLQDLGQAGLNDKMIQRIGAQLSRRNGQFKEGPVRWANTLEWEDAAARDAFRMALRSAVDRQIVTPGVADRPLFMSYEWGKTVGQYKSFAISSTQRLMLTALQKRDLAALNGLTIMLAMGMGVEWMKSAQAGRPGPEDPYGWFRAGIDRSGMIGIFGDFFNMAERTGVFPTRRGPLSSRYAARNTTSAILGPMMGLGESAVSLTVALGKGEVSQTETRIARRLMPYQNLFYTRWLFDRAEQGINEALGIPERATRRRR